MLPYLRLVFLFIFFPWRVVLAQDNTPLIELKNLEENGILLDKGWKFKAGDNPEWADPDYNDQAWQNINPTLDLHDSLPQIPKSGISWFRLHLKVNTNLLEQPMAIIMQQSGASEIYLNGRLIYRLGLQGKDLGKIVAYDPLFKPLPIIFTKNTHQVLALRFALQPNISYTTMFEHANPAFWIKLKPLIPAINHHESYIFLFVSPAVFVIGTFVLLVILHLAFYFFYPKQKANLSFALCALVFLGETILRVWLFMYGNEVALRYSLYNLCFLLILISDLFLLTAIYQLTEKKKDWVYFFLIFLAIIGRFVLIPQYGWGWIAGGALVELLIRLNILLIAIWAVRKQKRGAKIILWGAISCLVSFFLFLSQGVFSTEILFNLSFTRLALYNIAVLSIPFATSIYLGLDFAFINRSLEKKLLEVEELSIKTIHQEREKQEILATQKEMLEKQVAERTAALSESLATVKATQIQLVQKEKMASLGELTAGIAHEIQNPLNFVNNFSGVSRELCEELKEEITAGHPTQAKVIVEDISQNLAKIQHHGNRADSIVKGMLQHSRANSGQKQPTDINALAEEYLRLAYHRQWAQEMGFKVSFIKNFDNSIGKIEVVPEELGRVLLNLINNALYATQQKKAQLNGQYQPEVKVTTCQQERWVEIRVRDNGIGIPEKAESKIFQPFFTTKPSGQGTGLGLSLSYDIITKGHGGELKVETEEGAFTEVIICLPKSLT